MVSVDVENHLEEVGLHTDGELTQPLIKKLHYTFPGLYLNSVGSPMGSPLSFF